MGVERVASPAPPAHSPIVLAIVAGWLAAETASNAGGTVEAVGAGEAAGEAGLGAGGRDQEAEQGDLVVIDGHVFIDDIILQL